VAAVEVMVMNARIADLIREGKADEITDAVAEGEFFQMQTFTQALIEHVLSGKVDPEIAANAATNRHDFLVSLEQATKRQRADLAAKAAEAAAAEPPAPAAAPAAEGSLTLLQPPPPAEEGFGLRIAPTG
jgi:Tfp pilus assembly ATPase PilU